MNDTLIHEIVLRFRGGASMRRIAQSLHISRRTVRRVLDQVDQARIADPAPGGSQARPRRGSQLDAFEGTIVDLLSRYPDMTVQRIHQELRRLDYQGSYTLLCRRVQSLRPRSIVAPVRRLSSLLGGRSFHSLEHLNETALWWLAEVADVRVHRQTKARPLDRHREEQPHLILLPARPFDASEVVYRTVDAEGFVIYRKNFYSAPWRLIGQPVAVRTTADELIIHDRAFVVAARHPLVPRTVVGERRRSPDHEPPRDSQRRSEQLRQRFTEFGPVGTDFLEGLLAQSRYGKNQAERVLALVAVYPRQDVLAALERAVRYGAFSLAAVQRILAARSQPKTPLDALADDHRTYLEGLLDQEPTPPRPTSDYQDLLREEPHHGGAIIPPWEELPEDPESDDPDSGSPQPA
jgi:transposase/predicted HTH domain antitoxin